VLVNVVDVGVAGVVVSLLVVFELWVLVEVLVSLLVVFEV
jgi:hypothetical protein